MDLHNNPRQHYGYSAALGPTAHHPIGGDNIVRGWPQLVCTAGGSSISRTIPGSLQLLGCTVHQVDHVLVRCSASGPTGPQPAHSADATKAQMTVPFLPCSPLPPLEPDWQSDYLHHQGLG